MRYRLMMAVGLLGLSAPAWADAWDFILTNNTGKEITLIELSPDGTTWQKNKIDEDNKFRNLKAGMRGTIHFDKTATQCKWSIRATFADNTTAVFPAVNVCDATAVTIKYNGTTPAATGS